MVTTLDTFGDSDLILPLGRSNLTIDARNLQAGIQEGSVGGLHDLTTDGITGPDSAVIAALRLRISVLGPSIGTGHQLTIFRGQEVLLFNAEPRVVILDFVENLGHQITEVVSGGSNFVPDESLTQD